MTVPTGARQRPNVVVVALDDVGFGQLGAFGAGMETPTIDALAEGGLRYNRFHVTSLCSPTRAALLTGRNHHKVGMGFVADFPLEHPGYTARIPRSAATLAKVLADDGYFFIAVGKWHLAPPGEHAAIPPFDRWPLGMGFHRYYGFLGAKTNQWAPDLVEDNHVVEPWSHREPGRHLTEELVDRSIGYLTDLRNADDEMPFFLYLAPAAMHSPHHVGPEWVEPYSGRFDAGWEAARQATYQRQLANGVIPESATLTERPPWVQLWSSLDEDERRTYARMQEVFAGLMTHTDAQIGRLVDHLRSTQQLDNTIVMVLSDNGASAEGGPTGSPNEYRYMQNLPLDRSELLRSLDELGGLHSYNHYAWGWAWAGNTPFRLWKRYSWLGGTRTPLVVHWPDGISAAGSVRPQFCHAIDIMPTILDACGVAPPEVVDGVEQIPLQGASLRDTFRDPSADAPRQTQYFEMAGSRAILHRGWRATTDHLPSPIGNEAELVSGSTDFEHDHWALFEPDDFSEAVDVADQYPEVVAELRAVWRREADQNDVLPMTDTIEGRVAQARQSRPRPAQRGLRAGGGPIDIRRTPDLRGGGTVQVVLHGGFRGPRGVHQGVLCTSGDWHNGFGLYVVDGAVEAAWSIAGSICLLRAPAQCSQEGAHDCTVVFEARSHPGGTTFLLSVDGAEPVEEQSALTLSATWDHQRGPIRIGYDGGLPMTDRYRCPFPWTGRIDMVAIRSQDPTTSDPGGVVRVLQEE